MEAVWLDHSSEHLGEVESLMSFLGKVLELVWEVLPVLMFRLVEGMLRIL